MPNPETVKPADLRAAVTAMTDQTAHAYWLEMMSKARVQRVASPAEKTLRHRYETAAVFSTALLVLGAIATIFAIASGAATAMRRGTAGSSFDQ